MVLLTSIFKALFVIIVVTFVFILAPGAYDTHTNNPLLGDDIRFLGGAGGEFPKVKFDGRPHIFSPCSSMVSVVSSVAVLLVSLLLLVLCLREVGFKRKQKTRICPRSH